MRFSRSGVGRLLVGVLTILGLSGCATEKKAVATGPTPFDRTVVEDCYTVDLFTVAKIEPPGSDVPAEWARLSGKWGSAGWDGKWCHDLYVLKIAANGEVEVMDLHAPYEPWAKPATAFRRKGRISKDGHLRVAHGAVVSEYWLENGRLYGLRKEGSGQLRIAMLPRVNSKLF
ncbi:hypothetical protein G5B40_06375 [Pikeienuella piscinae]|uniref:Lipoprotein n=1 Tax=Pikeienuella piscinae TaxID=2748098 RepID=A0A7L5BT85_9RHOB|nr:hypothetical protein [Pikeienuella piscinae]QIE55110.1 hypothetical protein G5B40_06375 [Pikeienuella piscinae]